MRAFIESLNEKMQQEIQEISMETSILLHRAERCFYATRNYLLELKEFVKERGFRDQAEEIAFFKNLKPSLQKENIFWGEIMYIEANRPMGSKTLLEEYYHGVTKQINTYFQRNYLLYTYYKTNHTEEDLQLFLRETDCVPLFPESETIDMDTSFSTVNSLKIAKIMAFEEVIAFINANIESLVGNAGNEEMMLNDGPKKIVWTGTKAQFIEWVYATHATGVLNNGKATIKDAMEFLQFCLNIKATHYYGYMQSMHMRKKGRTPYIHLMAENLERNMDLSDEFPRYG